MNGLSPLTKDMEFGINPYIAKEYRKSLLEICRDLPKLKASYPGAIASISYFDLLKETNVPKIMQINCAFVDQFSGLLNAADIAGIREIKTSNGIVPVIDILEKYKNDIYPARVPQEPDDN